MGRWRWGWLWPRKSSINNYAPSDSEPDPYYNDDETVYLAEVISSSEEHKRKKKEKEEEEEDERTFNEAIKESLKLPLPLPLPVIDQDNNNSSQNLELYYGTTSLQQSHSNAPLQGSFESISMSNPVVNHHYHPRICDGCNSVIEENGRFVNVLGVVLHTECFRCLYCHKPINKKQYVSNLRGNFHRSCCDRYCYICGNKFARGENIKQHEFWKEIYCPHHETNGTPKCCGCERLEPKVTTYIMFDDERRLCVECMEWAVMSTDESSGLHSEILDFFESLNMKIGKYFPVFLVEKQALNAAEKRENIENAEGVVTRGICLSEKQTVEIVHKKPVMGPNKQLIGIVTEYRQLEECEVTAILILYGLPRLLTGSILAHEMMHAWLRLNGYKDLDEELEEGLCQELSHMWLETQTYSTPNAATSSSSSTTTTTSTTSKKGDLSDYERILGNFCKYQIETDESKYGSGFRKVHQIVEHSGLIKLLKKIKARGLKNFQDLGFE